MFLLIIISLQYYFLARVFKKNKLKTVLTVVGMFVAAVFMFSFAIAILWVMQVFPVELDMKNPNTIALNEYLFEKNIPIIFEIILFLLIGVFYFNFLKRKWTKEVILQQEPIIQEVVETIQKIQMTIPVKTDFYCHFHRVNDSNMHWIPILAKEIWNDCYKDIISQEQIDFMLSSMYDANKIKEALANGDQWEILKADNEPVGYIHYRIEENKLFLSKIYLKQDPKYKGLGQVMMNHVIDYGIQNDLEVIYLTVNKNNQKAIRFYEKNRFQNVKSETFDIGNGFVMDDYIYEKKLK
ncbi:MAG TPA: GNAT family N-acetyltransferase [Faecalibacter sp.]|uniref:GNAT family N-acetyltransferase n=1 Tax=Faecalibacter sp. LW9 TaxID=3103144 RepID=UPI002B0001A2|nr:GNAT family N-acetyltransferase [Faecalibacter sp. LW9]